jgi:predicted acyl esterase
MWTSLLGKILARRWRLPHAQTRKVVRERDLRIEMGDGAVLLADRWVARAAHAQPQPTVLVRSCYGRRGIFGVLHGRLLAERGLQVVIQSVRGTFGSEGTMPAMIWPRCPFTRAPRSSMGRASRGAACRSRPRASGW